MQKNVEQISTKVDINNPETCSEIQLTTSAAEACKSSNHAAAGQLSNKPDAVQKTDSSLDAAKKPKRKSAKSITTDICEVAIFTALLVASAFIKIPVPPVPFTLQTLVCLIGGGLLGKYKALAATALYIFLGLIGLPVFSSGSGFTYVLFPTFGYLLAMLFGSFAVGFFTNKYKGYVKTGITCFVTSLFMLLLGTLYMYLIFTVHLGKDSYFSEVMVSGFAMFIIPELLKSILATILIVKVKPIITRMHNSY